MAEWLCASARRNGRLSPGIESLVLVALLWADGGPCRIHQSRGQRFLSEPIGSIPVVPDFWSAHRQHPDSPGNCDATPARTRLQRVFDCNQVLPATAAINHVMLCQVGQSAAVVSRKPKLDSPLMRRGQSRRFGRHRATGPLAEP